jgi:hypothetical protein
MVSSKVKPTPPPREAPKILYIDAEKKKSDTQNDLNDLPPPKPKRPKKPSPRLMPPPNFPPKEHDDKIYTIVPVP